MAFPYTQVDLGADIYVAHDWTPITLRDKPITISGGVANEQTYVAPTKLGATLNNRYGHYSPRNPVGPYYGTIGRNTALRVYERRERDTFTRTVSNAWGQATTGETWSFTGSVGVLASDFAVTGTEGTHSCPSTSIHRITLLAGSLYRDVETRCRVRIAGTTNITGGDVEPGNLVVRGLGVTDYLMVRLVIDPSENVKISLMHYNGTIYASAVTVLTGWAGEALRVAGQIEGHMFRGKVWRDGQPEPYDWHVSAAVNTAVAPYAGWVAIRSGVASGNSNAKPLVFAYDDFEVRINRFAGEVSAWPAKWDASGHDRWVPITASGELRRLGQGASPVQSTYRRGISTAAGLRAYWPGEDGERSTSLAPAIAGHPPMAVSGAVSFASDNTFDCSNPLPKIGLGGWVGDVPGYVGTGSIQVRFLLSIPAAGLTNNSVIMALGTNGTARTWYVTYVTGGSIKVEAFDPSGTLILSAGPYAHVLNGTRALYSLELVQDGADIDWRIATYKVGDPFALFNDGTLAARTSPQALQVLPSPFGPHIAGATMGHISVQSTNTSIFDQADELVAYDGEAAGVRIARLCAENGIAFAQYGDLTRTARMGPQRAATLLQLLNDCTAVDLGILFEPRGVLGLGYRTRESLYNQTPTLTTTYGTLSDFEPVPDDQNTRNDVIVARKDGSEARSTQLTGPMSILPPRDGGAGRYDTKVTVNAYSDAQLADLAGFLRALGTVDEARYPTIKINFASKGFALSTTLTRAALALTVGDLLRVTDPPDGEPPDDVDQLVRGFSEVYQPWKHELTINGRPASPYRVLQLDDGFSRLGTDTTLTTGINSAVGSFQGTINDGVLWTTDPSQFPMVIELAGEMMTLTSVTGAASPQTFNVTRSLNGVSKPHTAGTPIRIRDAFPLA